MELWNPSVSLTFGGEFCELKCLGDLLHSLRACGVNAYDRNGEHDQ